MNGGGRRQLPSWMMRSTATVQVSTLETKGENKEICSVEPHTKIDKPLKKARTKTNDPAAPLVDNTNHVLKKCESRTRKRKSNDPDEGQGERFQKNEPSLLQPCKKSRRKGMSIKDGEDLVDDSFESDVGKKVDGKVRKKVRDNAPRKKHLKKLEEVHNVEAESDSTEDELTVEDLISIAEEYVKADREEFQKSEKMELDLGTKPLLGADSGIGSNEDLILHTESRLDLPLSSDSPLTKPLSSEGSINNQSTTDDPVQDMLELFLGSWMKKSREAKLKTDALIEEKTFDFELNKSTQNDTATEVAPVMKKKFSLKDNFGKLLD